MPDVNHNATDYAYANPIPGAAGAVSPSPVQGVTPVSAVVALGTGTTVAPSEDPTDVAYAPAAADFQDCITSPMESDMTTENPAFVFTEEG